MGVSEVTILWSILFAVAHLIVEWLIIRIESNAADTSFMHYTIICLTGRFGWIPFSEKFEKYTIDENERGQNDDP